MVHSQLVLYLSIDAISSPSIEELTGLSAKCFGKSVLRLIMQGRQVPVTSTIKYDNCK